MNRQDGVGAGLLPAPARTPAGDLCTLLTKLRGQSGLKREDGCLADNSGEMCNQPEQGSRALHHPLSSISSRPDLPPFCTRAWLQDLTILLDRQDDAVVELYGALRWIMGRAGWQSCEPGTPRRRSCADMAIRTHSYFANKN